ncbi:hypothetical protein M3P36_07790 [Altererythrobacter sp. KTW20L]|uniref:hypothetical protein n=1 Tax=Altererythrobacter sp. KTW20L TaxID=2942210 RepID=UPI0020C0E7E0|nr:hypothetical protein [Altererythrobacter sp. KTW20L]MCL6250939.1 hypothetical protein [Altererythrobacter sp. KTW20L]
MTASRSSSRRTMRGQPLVVLVALVACWTLVRAATWSSPLPEDGADLAAVAATQPMPAADEQPPEAQDSPAPPAWQAPPVPALPLQPAPLLPVEVPPIEEPSAGPLAAVNTTAANPRAAVPPRLAAGHAMLLAAGFAHMRVPPEIAAFFDPPAASAQARLAQAPSVPAAAPARSSSPAAARQSRWSADGWLMWRDDTTTPITSGRPSYGRSQLGAVVRYELAPGAAQRPQAYLRASAALQGAREQELAAGLSARPLARVPLRMAAELRASDRASGSEVRPAGYVVTELAPQSLPAGLVAEGYAQAGYVGGQVPTAFVDGQARLDRSLASAAGFDLRAGAAAWGGAQREGARLDVGPTASLGFQVGATRGRLAADYRFRVAGDAEPASGPAITLSAGF